MKRVANFLLVAFLFSFLFSCGPRPAYKTAEGKRKLKYYNDIQFGRDAHPKKTF